EAMGPAVGLSHLAPRTPARCPVTTHPPHHQQPAQAGLEATLFLPGAAPDETLVADPRALLTPAQLVDGRLLALLGVGHPGLAAEARGRRGDVRRAPGE